MERALGRGDGHLALPAHHLEPLADRLLRLGLERTEVVDLAGEAAGLSAVVEREAGGGELLDRPDGAASGHQAPPQIVRRQAER